MSKPFKLYISWWKGKAAARANSNKYLMFGWIIFIIMCMENKIKLVPIGSRCYLRSKVHTLDFPFGEEFMSQKNFDNFFFFKFWWKKFVKNIFSIKIFWHKKKFRSNKFLCQKNSQSKKILIKKFSVQKHLVNKKILWNQSFDKKKLFGQKLR